MTHYTLAIDGTNLFIKDVTRNSSGQITGYSSTVTQTQSIDIVGAESAIDLSNELAGFVGTRPIKR